MSDASPHQRFPRALLVCWAVALLLAVGALGHPFLLDDQSKIVDNPDLRDLFALPGRLVYPYHRHQVLERNDPSRPWVFLVYGLLYAIDGANPWVFHLFNALVHGLNGWLVWRLAGRLRGGVHPGEPAAWLSPEVLVAGLFLLVPIQAGTSFYAYGLSDLLGAAFGLASVSFSLAGATSAAALSLVGALGAKQSLVVVPVLSMIALAFDARAETESPSTWAFVRGLFAKTRRLWLIVIIYLVMRASLFGGLGDLESYGQAWGRWEYLFSQPYVILRYLALTFVPRGLALDHYLTPDQIPGGLKWFAGVAGLGVALALARQTWRTRGRGAWGIVAFSLAWYGVTLGPVSSWVPTVDLLVERRVYLANFGLFCGVASAWSAWRARVPRAVWVALGALAFYAGASVARQADFRSPVAAWRAVLEVYPASPRALNNLANALAARDEFDEAEALFARTLALHSDDYIAMSNYAALYQNERNPRRDETKALEIFRAARALHPEFAEVHYNIGRLLQRRAGPGDLAEAERSYLKALELKPTHVPALNNLAVLKHGQGDLAATREWLTRALRLDPNYVPAQQNWSQFFDAAGR